MSIDYSFKKKDASYVIFDGSYGAIRWNFEGLNNIFTERQIYVGDVITLSEKDIFKYVSKIKNGEFKSVSLRVVLYMIENDIDEVILVIC